MTLEEVNMRYLTGVSLMAICRVDGEEIDYPNSQTTLLLGDRLLVVGSAEELTALIQFAEGKITIK
jgi:CPA2 family monovalent cation:H+ antiporter-2